MLTARFEALLQKHPLLLLLGATALAFLPGLFGGLVWDDHFILHPSGPITSLDSLWRVWTGRMIFFEVMNYPYYRPIPDFSFALQFQVLGLHPFSYHLANLALHTANVWLAWKLVDLVVPEAPSGGKVLGLLIFALHPLGVESVHWLSCRSILMSQGFVLLAALAAVRFVQDGRVAFGALALLAFLAALLSKESAVVAVPAAAAFLLAGTRRERLRTALLLGLGTVALAVYVYLNRAAQEPSGDLTTLHPWAMMVKGAGFYLSKFAVPYPLLPAYAFGVQEPTHYLVLGLLLAAAVVGTVAWLLWRGGRVAVASAAALLFAAGSAALPFVGGQMLLADRYVYGSLFGLGAAAAIGSAVLGQRVARFRAAQPVLVLALGTLLGALTFSQSTLWVREDVLWRHCADQDPENTMVLYNLGQALRREGNMAEAIRAWEAAAALAGRTPDSTIFTSLSGISLMKAAMSDQDWPRQRALLAWVQQRRDMDPARLLPYAFIAHAAAGEAPQAQATEAELETLLDQLQPMELLFMAQVHTRLTKNAAGARLWYDRAREAGVAANEEIEAFLQTPPDAQTPPAEP